MIFAKDSAERQMLADFYHFVEAYWDVHADHDDAWWDEMSKKAEKFWKKYPNTNGFSRDIAMAVINRAGRINHERLEKQREGANDV
jgi:hypothetical protein